MRVDCRRTRRRPGVWWVDTPRRVRPSWIYTLCASCDASNQPDEQFCGCCGVRLPAVAPAPTLVPEADAALPAGERRQLTVFFCDLVGATPLSQQLDAEDWRDVLARVHEAVTAAVARFGGHVAKNLGDGARLAVRIGMHTGPVVIADYGRRSGRKGRDHRRVGSTPSAVGAPQRLMTPDGRRPAADGAVAPNGKTCGRRCARR